MRQKCVVTFVRVVCVLSMLLISTPVVLASNEHENPATQLVGIAELPANTFAAGPTSGQFIGEDPINGVLPPFIEKQPVQGFSGTLKGENGSFYVMVDNGFGQQGNSQDHLLRIYSIHPNFKTAENGSGTIEVKSFITLSDPDRLIPFTIVADLNEYPTEGTAPKDFVSSGIPVGQTIKDNRLLTGADFDPESIQQVEDGTFWLGDEFGPFLLHVDATGKLLDEPISLPDVQAPQNPYLKDPAYANLPSSRGFEGLALSIDGTKLYPILEGALATDRDQTRRIIYEFDLATKSYTEKRFFYKVEAPNHSIADFIAINENEFLVNERDGTKGDLNGFKRVFKIDLRDSDQDGFVDKEEIVNLLNIADPNLISLPGEPGDIGLGDPFAFPHECIENVVIIDSSTLGLLNDNNYPFSTDRNPGKPDDTEFILIRLSDELTVAK